MTRWFDPPADAVAVEGLEFRALTPEVVEADYAAVMRDIPMLRAWGGHDWPRPDFTIEENLSDLVDHHREQREGIALTYSVLAGDIIVGCIYVRPIRDALATRDIELPADCPVPPLDGVVRGWAHDIEADMLVRTSLTAVSILLGDGRPLWWMTTLAGRAQLDACDRLGLVHELTFGGAGATWAVRGAAR